MNPDKKIKASLAVFGTVVLASVVFLIFPLFSGIQQEAADLIAQKNTLAELKIKIENLENFQATHETYQSNLGQVEALFVDPQEPLGFIEFLEKESADLQVLIDIMPFSPNAIKDDPWPSMNFRLILIGPFPDFLNFFEKLASSPYLLEVLSLDVRHLTENEILTKKLDDFSLQNITATLLIKVYTK